jgi:hypothetical protein
MFDQLRTKEQLAYSVEVHLAASNGVLGLIFTMQSGKASPPKLDERFEAYFGDMMLAQISRPRLKAAAAKPQPNESGEQQQQQQQQEAENIGLTAAEFEAQRRAVCARKLDIDHSLNDEVERHWEELHCADGERCFNRHHLQVEQLATVSQAELVATVTHLLLLNPNSSSAAAAADAAVARSCGHAGSAEEEAAMVAAANRAVDPSVVAGGRRKLAVHVFGKRHAVPDDHPSGLVTDVAAFIAGNPLFGGLASEYT